MRILKLVLLFVLLQANVVNAQVPELIADTLVDERDGQVYRTVVIGDKVWMAENLNFVTQKSWCYANKAENCDEYGRLYFFQAAIEACPAGWHLPSDDEWKEMEKHLGMAETELNKFNTWRGTDQGEKLLSDKSLGFNILLAGYRNPPANNMLIGMQAFFWTSTVQNGVAFMRQFYEKSPKIFRKVRPKSWAFSVRCVKD